MSSEAKTVATTIRRQIGRDVAFVVDARQWVYNDDTGALTFTVGTRRGHVRKVTVDYDRGADAYNVVGQTLDRRTFVVRRVHEVEHVYAESLGDVVCSVAQALN